MSGSYLVQVHPVINSADRGSDIMRPSSPLKLEVRTKTLCVTLHSGQEAPRLDFLLNCLREKKKKIGWAISFLTGILNFIARMVRKAFCELRS